MAELTPRSEKRGRSLRRTLSGRFRRSKPKPEATVNVEHESAPENDSPSASLATRRTGRRFMSSIRRKAKSEGASNKSSAPPTAAPLADVERIGEQGDRVIWSLDRGHSTVSLIDVHLNEIGLLELEAFRAYAIFKLREQLDSEDDWSDPNVAARRSGRAASINSFLRKLRSRGELFNTSASGSPESSPRSPTTIEDGCIFGLSLDKVLAADRRRLYDATLQIPQIVHILINRLLTDGWQTEGIFRVSGSSRRVHDLAETFDSGAEPDISAVPASDIASLLKMFLRQLPEPVLTWQLYAAFLQVPGLPEAKRLSMLQHLCILLPEANRHVLGALLQLLVEIAKHADGPGGNKMDKHNLAVVMAPNLLRPDPKSPRSPKQKGGPPSEFASLEHNSIAVIELMIEMHEEMFMISRWHRDGMLRHHYKTSPQMVYTLTKGLVLRKNSLRPPTPPDTLSPSPLSMTASLARPKSAPGRSRYDRQSPRETLDSLGPRVSIAVSEFSNASDPAAIVDDLGPLHSRDPIPAPQPTHVLQPAHVTTAEPEKLADEILMRLGQLWDQGTEQARLALSQSYSINPAPFSRATLTGAPPVMGGAAPAPVPRPVRQCSVTTIDPPPFPAMPHRLSSTHTSANSSYSAGVDDSIHQAFDPTRRRRRSSVSTRLNREASARFTRPSISSDYHEEPMADPSIEGLARRRSRRRSSIRRMSGGGSTSPRTRRQSESVPLAGRSCLISFDRTDSDVSYVDIDDDNGTFV
eukprot:m.94777 g.94777  ORF g.94777 m.94777 type:complete len:752 (-) comp15003_c0_seq1:34-2289(-)